MDAERKRFHEVLSTVGKKQTHLTVDLLKDPQVSTGFDL